MSEGGEWSCGNAFRAAALNESLTWKTREEGEQRVAAAVWPFVRVTEATIIYARPEEIHGNYGEIVRPRRKNNSVE